MIHLNKNLRRALYILLLSVLMALPMLAADNQKAELRVYPVDEAAVRDQYQDIFTGRSVLDGDFAAETRAEAASDAPEDEPAATPQVATAFVSSDAAADLIIKYEGFSPWPTWDYQRWSIGHGSSYQKALEMFPEIKPEGTADADVRITEEQGRILLLDDLRITEDFLNDKFLKNNIVLNQNQFDALVSFTYNVGSGWWTYKNSDDGSWCQLKVMLLDDPSTWTEERAQAAFGTWRTAGGQVLPGLVRRRAEEATLFMTPYEDKPNPDPDPNPDPNPDPDPGEKPEETPDPKPVEFPDVEAGTWYYEYVLAAAEKGLMNGYDSGDFGPDDKLTRAQMVKTLANLVGVDLTAYADKNGGFSDVEAGAWYAPSIAWATELGLVNGRGDGTFDPDAPISRQHLCSIMARYLRVLGIAPDTQVDPFLDESQMDGTSVDDVYYCAGLNLVGGVGEGKFAPQGMATRAQCAKILTGMYELIGEYVDAA